MRDRKKKFLAALLAAAMVIGSYPAGSISAEEIPMELEVVEEAASVELQSEEISSVETVPEEVIDTEEGEVIFEDLDILETEATDVILDSSDDLILSDDLLVDPEMESVETEFSETENGFVEEAESEMITETSSEIFEESINLSADALTYGNYTYTVSGNNATITGYTGEETTISIPSSLEGYVVTTIGESVFKHNVNVIKVTISASVQSIGDYAFYGCNNLELVSLPNGVKKIGVGAFSGCEKLISITLPDTISEIGNYAFDSCKALTTVKMNYNSAEEYMVSVGNSAFEDCISLEQVELSENITSIGNSAFKGCTSLKTLTLPESLTSIGYTIIENAAVESITIPKNVSVSQWLWAGSSYTYGVLAGCTSLKEVIFEEGMTVIPSYICATGSYYINNIEKVTIPSSVQSIGNNAFYGCSNFTIYGYSGSYAEIYANEHDIPFIALIETQPGNGEAGVDPKKDGTGYNVAINFGNTNTVTKGTGTISFINMDLNETIASYNMSDSNVVLEGNILFIENVPLLYGYNTTVVVEPECIYVDGEAFSDFAEEGEWTFKTKNRFNISTDSWYFENFTGSSERYWSFWFPFMQAEELSDYAKKAEKGLCFGMVLAAMMIESDLPAVESFSRDKVKYIEKTDVSTELQLSAAELIRYLFATQHGTNEMQDVFAASRNDSLENLYRAVKSYEQGAGVGVIINILSRKSTKHTIMGVRTIDGEDTSKIVVYDPNHPLEERYLNLNKNTEGDYVSWNYDADLFLETFDSEKGGIIEYKFVSEEFASTLMNALRTGNMSRNSGKDDDNNLIALSAGSISENNTLLEIQTYGTTEETAEGASDKVLYWSEDDTIDVYGAEEGLHAAIIGENSSVEVSAPQGENAKLSLSADTNDTLQLQTAAGDHISVLFQTMKGSKTIERKTIESVSDAGTVNATINQGDVVISGVSSVNAIVKTDTKDSDGNIIQSKELEIQAEGLEKTQEYCISTNTGTSDKDITIAEDTTGDGTFDTVIASYKDPDNCEHQWTETIIKAASCSAEGTVEKECPICGKKVTESISKVAHQWNTFYTTDKAATCGTAGSKSIHCKNCSATKNTTVIPATGNHKYGSWTVTKAATALATGTRQCKCTVCGTVKTETIPKLTATIKLNMKTIPLKVKQSTTAFKVSGLAKGDSVKSYKSSNTKVATVNSKGKITARKKGTAKITVTLKSGKKATATVKVQTGTVKTTKVKVNKTKVTLKKGKSFTLKTTLTPLTSQQKVTYTSANKKIATVSSKGKIVAKKKGTVKITVKSGSKKVTVTVTVK